MSASGYQFAGYGPPSPGFCERPAKMVKPGPNGDTEWYWSRCKSARPSKCAPCAEIKRLDIAAIGRSGWTDSPSDRAFWATLTAPGQDVLPWDRALCSHSSGVRCSGDIGCKCEAQPLAIWHQTIGQRWSWFVTEVRRELGCKVQFFKTFELQQRGALHVHTMIRADGSVSAERVASVIKSAALTWGFGSQCDVQSFSLSDERQAARKSGYCAKYASKSADDLPAVVRLNVATGEIRSGGFRSWSASRDWGDTMRTVHLRRCQWATTAAVMVTGASDVVGGTGSGTVGGALDLYQDHYAKGTKDDALLPVSSSVLLV